MHADQGVLERAEKKAVPKDGSSDGVGIYLVDKPAGISSFAIVRRVRKALDLKKVGHAGTLDPFATGLLIVCAGRQATRRISCLMAEEKEYLAVLKLGVETETQDPEGRITASRSVPALEKKALELCLSGFVGESLQSPPMYSALKHKGKPLYYYARKGIKVEKEPRPVVIKKINLVALDQDLLTIQVTCGKGTYIRTLAADIGRALGTGAYLTELRRIRIGSFSVEAAVAGEDLDDPERGRRILLANVIKVDEIMPCSA